MSLLFSPSSSSFLSINLVPSLSTLLPLFLLIWRVPVCFTMQRRRHFWRLDTKSITLYQNETGKHFYKEVILKDILAIETAKGEEQHWPSPCIEIIIPIFVVIIEQIGCIALNCGHSTWTITLVKILILARRRTAMWHRLCLKLLRLDLAFIWPNHGRRLFGRFSSHSRATHRVLQNLQFLLVRTQFRLLINFNHLTISFFLLYNRSDEWWYEWRRTGDQLRYWSVLSNLPGWGSWILAVWCCL